MRCRLLVAFLILASARVEGGGELTKDETKAIEAIGGGIEKFSLELILRIALELPDENVATSPFSVWTMLSVVSEGAQNETLAELEKVLRHPSNFVSMIRTGFKVIRRTIADLSYVEYIDLNSMYFDKQVAIKKDYQKLIDEVYFTRGYPVDFKSPSTVSFMNDHFSSHSDGMIRDIVTEDDLNDGNLILLNGVFFQGKWKVPFDKRLTRMESFYNEAGQEIGKVNMMTAYGVFHCVKSEKLKSHIIEIPYGVDGHLSMVVILPNNGVKLKDVYTKFTQFRLDELFEEYLQDRPEDRIQLKVPRMGFTTDLILNGILMNSGIYDIFDPVYSNLSAMASTPLHLSRVIHQTKIHVMEDGALHQNAGQHTGRPIFVNKPFLFLIIEKRCKFILLGGAYRVPQLF